MGGGCETRELGWAGKARLQTRVASWASRRATGRLATRAEEPPGAREEACALLSGGHPQTLWFGVNFSTERAELTLTQATTQTSLAPPREAKEASARMAPFTRDIQNGQAQTDGKQVCGSRGLGSDLTSAGGGGRRGAFGGDESALEPDKRGV